MATINPQQDPNNPQQPGQPTTGGAGGAGSASPGVGASQATSPVQQNQAPQQNQSFNDVSAYLNANQGGGTQLGQQVAQNVTNQYNTTKQGIDTSAQTAIGAANSGYVPENTQLIQQVASNPQAAANDQSQLGAFQGQLNDQYSGPTSYADLGTQQGNVANAQQYGNLINTPGGANVLTQQVENQLNPGQTNQGINTLDTLLLTGNPNAANAVQTAATPYKDLGTYLNTQAGNVNNAIQIGQTGAVQTAQDALAAFTGQSGALTNLNQAITGQTAQDVAAAQAQQAGLNADIKNLYGGVAQNNAPSTLNTFGAGQSTPWYNTQNYNVGQLSPQDLASMGITQDQWTALQGALTQAGTTRAGVGGNNFAAPTPTSQLDISQFLNEQNPTQAITNATTATPQQYQQMAAIQQLLGSKTPQGTAINPALAAQAGTAPTNPQTFDYTTALAQAQALAQQEQAAANAETSGLTSQADLAHAQGQHQGGFGGFMQNVISKPFNNPITSYLENPLTAVPAEQKLVQSKV